MFFLYHYFLPVYTNHLFTLTSVTHYINSEQIFCQYYSICHVKHNYTIYFNSSHLMWHIYKIFGSVLIHGQKYWILLLMIMVCCEKGFVFWCHFKPLILPLNQIFLSLYMLVWKFSLQCKMKLSGINYHLWYYSSLPVDIVSVLVWIQ